MEPYQEQHIERYEEPEEEFLQDPYMEQMYRAPLFVPLVFVVTMLAIYFAGRTAEESTFVIPPLFGV